MAVALAQAVMAPRPFRIERTFKDLSDTFTVTLRPEGGTAPFPFRPGQFNMLYAFGQGEVPISIAGDPGQPETLVHTIRAVGVVTKALSRLRPGEWIGVRGPFGSHWPVEEAAGRDVVIVAGGVGLAPLRPAILAILRHRGRYGRFVILYGARTPSDILYRRELERWSARLDTYVDVTVDRASEDWHGGVGVVTKLIRQGGFDPDQTVAMVCGPETMIRFAVEALAARGVEPARVFVSLERNMRCAVGFCGHCQLGGTFVCRDGPVFAFDRIERWFQVREL